MTSSSTLFPDDLMMEYDLLQFMENADASHAAPPASSQSFVNVDDLLSNATVGLDFADTASSTAHQQFQQILLAKANTQHPANATNTSSSPTAVESGCAKEECEADALAAEASALLDDILLNGDDLLVHLEAEAAALPPAAAGPTPPKAACSPCSSACHTDADGVSSPCPSVSSDANCKSPPPSAGLPSSYFDELSGMAKLDASISPACTPSHGGAAHLSLGSLVLTSSPSHDGASTEGDETSSLDGATEDEADELGVASHAPQIPSVVVEEEVNDEADMAEAMEEEDEDAVQHQQDLLAKEAKYLEAQYDYLVSRAKSSRAARQSVKAKRRAREDQQQLVQKTQDNSLLTQLVSQQQVYMDNFKAMLAFAPVNDIRMALMTPIESYIRLGRDFDERRRTILALREEKLDMTYKYIEEKARGIDVNQPYQYSDVFERFGKYYSVHFAVSKYEGVEVGQVVKVVYDQMAGKDESIAAAMGCLTIRESYDQIKCNFLHQRIVSSLKWSEEFEEGLPEMESNSLFFCRFVGDTAVFATDYIDQDDLHPYLSKDRIRKDVSSGVVLTSHVDADGKRCVIMKKFLMAKFHMYPHNLSEKLTTILFNKMPCVSQKVTKMIDEKLLESRDTPLPSCSDAMAQQAAAQTTQPHVPQQC